MGLVPGRNAREDGQPTLSFDLTTEQAQKIARIRQSAGMSTGEVLRAARDAVNEAALHRNPAPRYEQHFVSFRHACMNRGA